MNLIQLLLPLKDNEGKRYKKGEFRAVAEELADRFGGLTAHTRAPAEGLWKEKGQAASEDEIIIYEVMAEKLDERWWRTYRRRLEKRFRQKELIVRAQEIRQL